MPARRELTNPSRSDLTVRCNRDRQPAVPSKGGQFSRLTPATRNQLPTRPVRQRRNQRFSCDIFPLSDVPLRWRRRPRSLANDGSPQQPNGGRGRQRESNPVRCRRPLTHHRPHHALQPKRRRHPSRAGCLAPHRESRLRRPAAADSLNQSKERPVERSPEDRAFRAADG